MTALKGPLVAAALLGVGLAASAAPASPAPERFTFTAGGDMIGPYHAFSKEDDPALAAVSTLFSRATLGFANQEGSIFDLAGFTGFPASENGGGYPLQPAAAAAAIKALGVTMVSKANNHATDWGVIGLLDTLDSLKAAGVTQAGAGVGPAEARSPAYVTTSAGVAALVDAASTFPPMSLPQAAVTRGGVVSKPGPGISALHVRRVRLVTGAVLDQLRAALGHPTGLGGELRIGDQLFRAAPAAGDLWEMNPDDEQAILGSIAAARRNASFVVFSIHAHETDGDEDPSPPVPFQPMVLHLANEAPSPNDPTPAAFEPQLFHAAVDAGADAVVRTGPHTLNGIEIYKGKPIFYGLGSLFFDFGGRRSFRSPGGEALTFPDEWFESVVPVSTYEHGRLAEVRLYPIVIEANVAARSGVPRLAAPQTAQRILARLQRMSTVYGTRIEIEDGVGLIRGPKP